MTKHYPKVAVQLYHLPLMYIVNVLLLKLPSEKKLEKM